MARRFARHSACSTGISLRLQLVVGGLTPVSEATFLTLLGASLDRYRVNNVATALGIAEKVGPAAARFMPLVAVPLGYLAGLVGIGGGIFLAPILHLTRWNGAREVAATASLFILVNSLFGSPVSY